ncbi:MAG TPA: hypothetical protein VFX50_05310, partial [Gemmatimonadales bacterium]|nr:hypothetical protein [Gemmatimonadales bacterium]
MKCLRQLAAVAAVFAGLAGAGAPVQAQPRGPVGTTVAAPAALRVDAFDVEQVDRLGPGTALRFSLFGTPGGRATLAIDGAAAHLELDEVQAGVYEGTYVVGAADAVAPAGPVRAELRVAGRAVVV